MSNYIDIDESSRKLSELDQLSSIGENDYIVLERGSKSFKMSYKDFKKNVFQEISSRLGLGTISAEDPVEYAKFDHGHPYTDFWYFSSYGPQSEDPSYRIGTFNVDTYGPGQNVSTHTNIPAYAPKYKQVFEDQTQQYTPYGLGQIIFINSGKKIFQTYLHDMWNLDIVDYSGIKNIDINSSNIPNGTECFAIPNGATLTCNPNEFKDACRMFAGNENATSFTVPDIDMFLKCTLSQNDSFKKQQYKNVLIGHNHSDESGSSSYEYTKDKPFKFNAGKFWVRTSDTQPTVYKSGYMHWGGAYLDSANKRQADPKPKSHPVLTIKKLDINIDIKRATIAYAGKDEESYPDYFDLQALMYIGRK